MPSSLSREVLWHLGLAAEDACRSQFLFPLQHRQDQPSVASAGRIAPINNLTPLREQMRLSASALIAVWMLPHLGQGANQSMEDGMALATILACVDKKTGPAALLAYERLRRERVALVQRGARENGLRYDSSYADLGVRDAEIKAHAAFRRRLYDHDVVPEAQAAAAALT
jgi:2-polyprenyl-6-methoxyphenol hydroxylase-like FAD-dependent oxidoreductase